MQVIIKQLYEYFKMEYIVIIITSFLESGLSVSVSITSLPGGNL